jgi:hypothetical protein
MILYEQGMQEPKAGALFTTGHARRVRNPGMGAPRLPLQTFRVYSQGFRSWK